MLELDQLEHGHEPLARFEPVEALHQFLGAGTAEVVEQVVAVGRDSQLAQPSEDDRDWSLDVDCAPANTVGVSEMAIARKRRLPLGES
jgi:hypothetical protein